MTKLKKFVFSRRARCSVIDRVRLLSQILIHIYSERRIIAKARAIGERVVLFKIAKRKHVNLTTAISCSIVSYVVKFEYQFISK
jgi:hypothetical protein